MISQADEFDVLGRSLDLSYNVTEIALIYSFEVGVCRTRGRESVREREAQDLMSQNIGFGFARNNIIILSI